MNNVLNNGTKVKLLDSTIEATIIGVCVRGVENQTVEYHVQWMSGSDIKDFWIYEYQVHEIPKEEKKVGFVNYDDETKKLN